MNYKGIAWEEFIENNELGLEASITTKYSLYSFIMIVAISKTPACPP